MEARKAEAVLAMMDRRPLTRQQSEALDKALIALRGLLELHIYIEPDDPSGGPSSADTCDALYTLMHRLGLEVV